MKRRQLLAGVGMAAAGSTVFGTGAFTSTTAQRSVSVGVANEENAYLSLDDELPQGRTENASISEDIQSQGNELVLDFNGNNIGGGQGVGKDSIYEFDNIFVIENQGTQPIFVQIDNVDIDGNGAQSGAYLEFYVTGDSNRDRIDGSTQELELPVGTPAYIGARVVTDDSTTLGTFNKGTTVHAQSDSFLGSGTPVSP
ncbi:DUF1102 domain-containing protein [Haloplanus rallus]|uniref:DUF1102 domain-containing protein n=1 Tax=Haloplanus rallus TaxID=1816183 RepID=A0A6B9FEB8_9EURY|nr:DUF1102 domain-containing protein [Haloplanus rallus]QGX93653.1 DUF1102 domain-containing protein [Haloplanus rallus]